MSVEAEQIKQRLDIVDVLKDYIQLKKAGANYKGLCPFHQEKNPSFMVSQSKQIWHCFGCQKGGDVFSFVQDMEGMDFFETLVLLGGRAGVKVEQRRGDAKVLVSKKQELFSLLALCAEFYHTLLTEHDKAAGARDYVLRRGLKRETVDLFQIGYAPDAWDVLLHFLEKRGYSRSLILASGMLVANEEKGSVYDRFRERLMIPLRDVHGNVVGFTARTLKKDEQGGKYINTPQTEVYDKSRMVFGLHLAKQAIKEAGQAIVVEGNMDVIASHQVGVKNVVAVSGTALTQEQLTLLKRFTDTLVFSFDADSAGYMAMRRGVELALPSGFTIKVLEIPVGKDPDECIQQGVQHWRQAIEEAKPVVDVVLEKASRQHDLTSSAGKKRLAEDVLRLLSRFSSPVEQDHYLQKLAVTLQVSEQALREVFESIRKPVLNDRGQPSSSVKPAVTAGNGGRGLSGEDEAALGTLALFVLNPSCIQEEALEPFLYQIPLYQDLYKNLKVFYTNGQQTSKISSDFTQFSQQLNPDQQSLLAQAELYGDNHFVDLELKERREELIARIRFLKRIYLSRQLQRVQTSLTDAEQANNLGAIRSLSEEFQRISSQWQSIN